MRIAQHRDLYSGYSRHTMTYNLDFRLVSSGPRGLGLRRGGVDGQAACLITSARQGPEVRFVWPLYFAPRASTPTQPRGRLNCHVFTSLNRFKFSFLFA